MVFLLLHLIIKCRFLLHVLWHTTHLTSVNLNKFSALCVTKHEGEIKPFEEYKLL